MYEDINPVITRNGNTWNVSLTEEDIAKLEKIEKSKCKQQQQQLEEERSNNNLYAAGSSSSNNNNNDVMKMFNLTKVITQSGNLGSKDLLYDSIANKDNPKVYHGASSSSTANTNEDVVKMYRLTKLTAGCH